MQKKYPPGGFTIDAKIVDTGPLAADGCGYLVQLDSTANGLTFAFPSNLERSYQVNNLKVRITYRVTVPHGYGCGMRVFVPADYNNFDIVFIDAISKR